jgi:hypothetical protein
MSFYRFFTYLALFGVFITPCLSARPGHDERPSVHAPSPRATQERLTLLLESFHKQYPSFEAARNAWAKLSETYRTQKAYFFAPHGEVSGTTAAIFLNQVLLSVSQKRIESEIEALEKRLLQSFPKPWMVEAEQARLETKKHSLLRLESLKKRLAKNGEKLGAMLEVPQMEAHLFALESGPGKSGLKGPDQKLARSLKENTEAMQLLAKALDSQSSFSIDSHLKVLDRLAEWNAIEESALEAPMYSETIDFLRAKADVEARFTSHRNQSAFFEFNDKEIAAHPERKQEVKPILEKMGVVPQVGNRSEKDLSAQFHAPRSQGKAFSCVAHALTSDMGSHMKEEPSAAYAYALLTWGQLLFEDDIPIEKIETGEVSDETIQKTAESVASPENFPRNVRALWKTIASQTPGNPAPHELANRGIFSPLSIEILKKHGLPSEGSAPSHLTDFIPADLNTPSKRTSVLKRIETLNGPITFSEVKALIDSDQPFQAAITTDARRFHEDWIQILPERGSISHVLNVVGYGEGIDPKDNQNKPYVVLRDSFTDGKYHYKASVESFLPWVGSVLRVKEVGTLEKPVEYVPLKQ